MHRRSFLSVALGQPAVSFRQRFASSLSLNIHWHVIVAA
jgi:hypothetical protein